jgi:ketosteroid isomerase-like protein
MSDSDVELVRRWVALYNARDMEGFAAVCHTDFEKHSVFAGLEGGQVFRGPADFPFGYFEAIDAAYESFTLEPLDFIDAGNAVVVVVDAHWRGRGSGAEGSSRRFIVFWSRSGKLTRDKTFSDRSAALEAAAEG